MQKARRTLFAVTLLAILQAVEARLTRNGLPGGQTVAPTGRDFLLNAPLRLYSTPPKKAILLPWMRRRKYVTPSTDHPFLTLRDAGCASATPLAIRDDEGWIGVVRSVSAAQLSEMMTRSGQSGSGGREITIILFHGGVECEWSREFWGVWTEFSRRMRRVCVVAIDGANDSMMNYNLMVLGFPTVMRVSGERSSDTFRGNRTIEELLEWVVEVGGGPPMDTEGWDGIEGDFKWLEVEKAEIGRSVKVLDVGENAAMETKKTNWALVGANVVSVMNIGCVLWYVAVRWMRRKPRRTRRHRDRNTQGAYYGA